MRRTLQMSIVSGSVALASWSVLLCAAAAGDPDDHLRSRFFLGPTLVSEEPHLEIDGVPADEGPDGSLGVAGGYGHTLVAPWFSILGVVRYHPWDSAWSDGAGEERRRVDLAFGPQTYVRVNQPPNTLNVYWYAALTAGGSVAWIEPGPHRAITESYDTGYGINLGATTGLALHPVSPRLFGWLLEISYLYHPMSITHRAETIEPPVRSSEETYTFRSRGVHFSLGVELWL